ncbi:potassium channel family protein [Micropruina sp.]|uniref:potassium channel family protein n=1 Tax=Micropruina sp. TaxID=2737536 RepID=UPI0039E34C94
MTSIPRGTINNVTYLFLRRMRLPLGLVILLYTVSVFGLALMPGVNDAGHPTEGMGLFNAFYVISYTATTIGFGELPHPYSTAQRMWMTVSIYLTVTGWSYAVVTVVGLLQEPVFQNALRHGRHARRIRNLREPFYIVCGVGETGTLVCHGLDRLRTRFVVIDADSDRIEQIKLENFLYDPPSEVADASQPATLTGSGLLSPYCRGVMALTVDDATNRAIAVSARLLRPGLPVMARVGDADTDHSRGAFGGDMVTNPFERFSTFLALAVARPERYRMGQILTGFPGDDLPEPHHPPRGHWIMCGYGRFGHGVREALTKAGNEVTVIDRMHYGEEGVDIKGTGTDSASLIKAGIEHAVGIVAGNASDLKNLAIALVARDLKPDIFIVTRQNQMSNTTLFDAFEDDLCMQPSRIVAREFLALITTPLLARFRHEIRGASERWSAELTEALSFLNGGYVPELWGVTINDEQAAAVVDAIRHEQWVNIGHLLVDPYDAHRPANALVLMVARGEGGEILPTTGYQLEIGDQLLIAGSRDAARRLQLTLNNPNVLFYVRTGRERGGGWVWNQMRSLKRWWIKSRQRHIEH